MSKNPHMPASLRRAAADHAAFGEWVRCGYDVAREWERPLDRHVEDRAVPLIISATGTFTSALLASWGAHYAHSHPDVPLFVHHVGCTRESRDPDHLVLRLLAWIRECCRLREPVPVSTEARTEILPNWLARLAAAGPAVIAIGCADALDDHEAADAMAWLPEWLPDGIRLVIGVAPGATAEVLRARGWMMVESGSGEAGPPPLPEMDSDAGRVLAALWCARRGLTREQIGALLPETDVDRAMAPLADRLFEAEGRLALAGADIRDGVRRHWLADSGDRQMLERRLADLFHERVDEDALDARPWLLTRAGDWHALADMLGKPPVLEAMLTDRWRGELLDRWRDWGSGEELARHYVDCVRNWPGDEPACGRLVLQLVRALRELPESMDAEPLLAEAARRLDPGDVLGQADLAALRGTWLTDVERHAEAEPLLRSALQAHERDSGPDHADTRTIRHRLATVLEERGASDDAITLYRTTLRHREATLDQDDPGLIPHLANLAAILRATNDLEAAKSLYQRALALAERHYGNGHPQTAATLDALAGLLYSGNDLEQAELCYQRALGIAENAFGPRHPATAAAVHNLGTVMDAREQFETAAMLFRRALEIRTAVFGEDHVDTASSLHNLAGTLDVMGDRDEAESLYRRAVAIWERLVGEEHPATATSVNNLADVLREKGERAEAESLYRRNLDTWIRLLGERHPHVAMTRSELAMLLADHGPPDEAEALLEEAVQQTADTMGWDSIQHINTVTRYAALLRDSHRRDEARRMLRQTLERAQEHAGMLSPRIQKLQRHLEALDRNPDTLH